MANKCDSLRALVKKAALKAHAHSYKGKRLKGSLEEALISIKYLEGEVSSLKDEVMVLVINVLRGRRNM